MKKLLQQIVDHLVTEFDAINATIEHLDALGVQVDGRGVVVAGKDEFIALRDGIAEKYYDDVDCKKDHAANVAREFLADCGYRERAKKRTKTKKTPTAWKKAVMKSVKHAKVGKNIMLGGVEYAPVK